MYDFYLFTYLDQIGNQLKIPNPGNQLKVPNPLYKPSLQKENFSKDLLQKKETTKIIFIQETEQGKII